MQTPPYLKRGDKVAIVATARKVSPEEMQTAINILKGWGLEVVLGRNLFESYNQFAGSDKQRVDDFNSMLADDGIRAIFCARGGYGTVRIIDNIDFSNFIKKPKWIVGFSDVTVLHSHIHNNFDTETLHAAMPFNFRDSVLLKDSNTSLKTLKKALFGEELNYSFNSDKQSKQGVEEGVITGGNLSILYSLTGSVSDINTDGKILFIEDIDEYLYHIDRMMMNLKRSGKLENLKGLIVGNMTDMKDNKVAFSKTAEEIILEAVDGYNYPVCIGFPAGHIENNLALILGRKVKLSVEENITSLQFNI